MLFHPDPRSAPTRFACILQALLTTLVDLIGRKRIPESEGWAYWNYVQRAKKRFARIIARLEAGTLHPPRPRKVREVVETAAPAEAPAAADAEGAAAAVPARKRLPTKFAWLTDLALETVFAGTQLQALLHDPEMQQLLAQAPQLARIFRPLLHMLAIRLGPDVHLLPPLPRAPRRTARAKRAPQSAEAKAAAKAAAAPISLSRRLTPEEFERLGSPEDGKGRRKRPKFFYIPGFERYSIA